MLLNLPPELIQLVLLKSSTPAFLQAALTCSALYRIASSCRKALIHHLQRTPGFSSDISSLDTQQLFLLLRRLASQQLYGAQFYADCVSFGFGEQKINVKASSLTCFNDRVFPIIGYRNGRTVHVFRVEDKSVQLELKINIPWDQPGRVEILKTAFDGYNSIYILQRFTPFRDEHALDAEHPFVKHALQSPPKGRFYLTRHSFRIPDGPAQVCAFPNHDDWEPCALAVAHDDNGDMFAISWRDPFCPNYEVMLYTNLQVQNYEPTDKFIDLDYQSRQVIDESTNTNPRGSCMPITGLALNDKSSQLLYYYQGSTLYGSFQAIPQLAFPPSPRHYPNATPVQFSDSLNLLFSIGIPFFGTHQTQDTNGFETCRWRYLAFGIATHREEQWTVGCLLRSGAVCRASNCGHVLHLERGRRLRDWVITARLWGFRDSCNSPGCRVATSRLGTRIAVANWNVIYVWALEPSALIDQNESGYYPPSSCSDSTGYIELQPVVLPLDAVCHQLHFTDQENSLIAITDRGLMCWDLGPCGRGQRTFHELAVSD